MVFNDISPVHDCDEHQHYHDDDDQWDHADQSDGQNSCRNIAENAAVRMAVFLVVFFFKWWFGNSEIIKCHALNHLISLLKFTKSCLPNYIYTESIPH